MSVFDLLMFFSPILSLALNVLSGLLTYRCVRQLGLLKSIYLGFSVGFFYLFVLGSYIASISDTTELGHFIANLVSYCALGYCYFHFINLGQTARRIRILRELYDSKKGLSKEEILSRYNAKEIFQNRIARLLNSSQIVLRDGRYFIKSPILLLIAKTITLLKIIVLGKRSEFSYL